MPTTSATRETRRNQNVFPEDRVANSDQNANGCADEYKFQEVLHW